MTAPHLPVGALAGDSMPQAGEAALNWDDLRIVSAVCDTTSFTRAARLLGMNETTVSRRVARLERLLGLALFEAVDGQRQPTDACRAITGNLHDMTVAAEDAVRKLREADYTSRKFRLTTIAAIAEYCLAPHLSGLLDALPELILTIDASDQNADMSRWEADFAIRLNRPKQGTFLIRRIGTISFNLLRPRDRQDDGLPFVAYPDTLADTPEMRALFQFAPPRAVRVETSNLQIMRRFLKSGKAMGVLPDFMLADFGESDGIEIVPGVAEREIWLLTQPHLRNDPLARYISEWCADLFAARDA